MTSDTSRRTLLNSIFLVLGMYAVPAGVTRGQGAEQYTFAVLGTDKRTSNDPENSDVIMVSRVTLDAGPVRTLSIPRDLYVEIPGHGYDKINAAFNLAVKADPQQRWDVGAAATVATITHNFGLHVDGVAFTDMSVFPQIVDTAGGITVNNPYDLTDQNWPAGMVLPAGPFALDGALALSYVRARSQDGDGGTGDAPAPSASGAPRQASGTGTAAAGPRADCNVAERGQNHHSRRCRGEAGHDAPEALQRGSGIHEHRPPALARLHGCRRLDLPGGLVDAAKLRRKLAGRRSVTPVICSLATRHTRRFRMYADTPPSWIGNELGGKLMGSC